MYKEINNIFKESIEKASILFSVAELKATLNAFLIPLLLMVASKNVLTGLCWVLLISIVYKTVQKEKTENAKLFFTFLVYESIIILLIAIVILSIGIQL